MTTVATTCQPSLGGSVRCGGPLAVAPDEDAAMSASRLLAAAFAATEPVDARPSALQSRAALERFRKRMPYSKVRGGGCDERD